MPNDEETIELLHARNESGLSRVSGCYGKLYHSIARKLLRSKEEAEECVNDALLDIWNSIPPQRPRSLQAYGCMLTRRRCIDRIRFLTAEKRAGAYAVALEELGECVGGGLCPETDDSEEIRSALNAFIGSLPPKKRRIFVGRYFAFASIEELAKQNGTTKNAVQIQLTRMRGQLRKYLKDRGIFI